MNDNKIEFQLTEDGSPTAKHILLGVDSEIMHHSGGALSESIYIFGPVIKWGFETKMSPRFLSVGLGLGYIEFLIAAYCLQECEPQIRGLSDDLYIESYESDPRLIKNLIQFINGEPTEYSAYYDLILKGIERHMGVDSEDIVQLLLDAYDNKTWMISPALSGSTSFIEKFDVIMYDLYSAKTLEEYWTEEFLNEFLQKAANPNCAFATYSAKGSLKRALKNQNFYLVEKTGFLGKRESTLAFRKNF